MESSGQEVSPTDLHAKIDALNAEALSHLNSDPKQLLALSREAHALAVDAGYTRGIAESLRGLAVCRYYALDHGAAADYLSQALELSKQLLDESLEVKCLHLLAVVYYGSTDYKSSILCNLQAMPIAQKLGMHSVVTKIAANVSLAYGALGDLQSAFDGYMEVLTTCELHPDMHTESATLNNIGLVYRQIGNNDLASDYFFRSLKVSRDAGVVYIEGLVSNNIANLLMDQEKFDEASEINESMLKLGIENGIVRFHGHALLKRAKIAIERGQETVALSAIEEAEEVCAQVDDTLMMLDTYLTRASLLLNAGDPAQACAVLAVAAEKAEAVASNQEAHQVLQDYMHACEKAGDFEKALALHKRIYDIEKRLFDENAEKRAKALEVRQLVKSAKQEANQLRQDTARLADSEAALTKQLLLDPLTGLANRRAMEEWLTVRFHDAKEMGTPLVVALADVDHFKSVNDRLSHQIGDDVLMKVAGIIRAVCSSGDLAGRYGGEEFVLAFAATDLEIAAAICDRIRQEVETFPWRTVHPDLHVTISIGLCADKSLGSYEKMLSDADQQLYRAKHEGRNRVRWGETVFA